MHSERVRGGPCKRVAYARYLCRINNMMCVSSSSSPPPRHRSLLRSLSATIITISVRLPWALEKQTRVPTWPESPNGSCTRLNERGRRQTGKKQKRRPVPLGTVFFFALYTRIGGGHTFGLSIRYTRRLLWGASFLKNLFFFARRLYGKSLVTLRTHQDIVGGPAPRTNRIDTTRGRFATGRFEKWLATIGFFTFLRAENRTGRQNVRARTRIVKPSSIAFISGGEYRGEQRLSGANSTGGNSRCSLFKIYRLPPRRGIGPGRIQIFVIMFFKKYGCLFYFNNWLRTLKLI